MGQKSNLITLRKHAPHSVLFNQNKKIALLLFKLLSYNNILFSKQGFFISYQTINYSFNKLEIHLSVFYTSKKLTQYKRLVYVKSNFNKTYKLQLYFLTKVENILRSKITLVKTNNLNSLLIKKNLNFFYNKFKNFAINIFDKKFNLFIDFIKILDLLYQKKLSIRIFLEVLGLIFCNLHKKKHPKFVHFLDNVIVELVNKPHSPIKGIKILISGKLLGRPRKSKQLIVAGTVPLQTLNNEIFFEKIHTNTIYGVFGFKIWILRNR